jgi:hypothetical protein
MNTRAEHIAFVRLNGPQISARAWQRYQEAGRGTICVMCEEHNEAPRMVPYEFLPAVQADSWSSRGMGHRSSALVAEYDPDLEVIICFLSQEHGERTKVDTYRIKPTPSPRDAANRE